MTLSSARLVDVAPAPAAPPAALQAALAALPAGADDWAVRAIDLILAAADRAGCTDLHLLARRDATVARVRRHGTLTPLATFAPARHEILVARLKVMAGVPGFVRHEPQDGRIDFPSAVAGAPPRALRAAFLPALHGETVVIRFPEPPGAAAPALDALGMAPPALAAFRAVLARGQGMVAVTGPASSGKTTTLHAAMAWLDGARPDRLNFVTIEDPVERELPFATQVPVNEARGMTFDRALRAALRADPDVLMLGEARDAETARIATQAALSGHLVLTTVHAGRAARVPARLLGMGVAPHLVAGALSAAVAQRLARTPCGACGGVLENVAGCPACMGSGVGGRVGLFEVVVVTEALRGAILAREGPDRLAALAAAGSTGDLAADARRMAAEGGIIAQDAECLAEDGMDGREATAAGSSGGAAEGAGS